MTNLYDFDKRVNTCSSSEWQASVRSIKLCNAILCTGVFLFYIKRHLMSGNEFACSLGSSSAIIAWVWTQKTRWKTLANNVRRYSSRCVRALRHAFTHVPKHTLAPLTCPFNVSPDPAGAGHSWAESMAPLFRPLCSIAHSCWIPHIHTRTHLTRSGQLLHPWSSPHMGRGFNSDQSMKMLV